MRTEERRVSRRPDAHMEIDHRRYGRGEPNLFDTEMTLGQLRQRLKVDPALPPVFPTLQFDRDSAALRRTETRLNDLPRARGETMER